MSYKMPLSMSDHVLIITLFYVMRKVSGRNDSFFYFAEDNSTIFIDRMRSFICLWILLLYFLLFHYSAPFPNNKNVGFWFIRVIHWSHRQLQIEILWNFTYTLLELFISLIYTLRFCLFHEICLTYTFYWKSFFF